MCRLQWKYRGYSWRNSSKQWKSPTADFCALPIVQPLYNYLGAEQFTLRNSRLLQQDRNSKAFTTETLWSGGTGSKHSTTKPTSYDFERTKYSRQTKSSIRWKTVSIYYVAMFYALQIYNLEKTGHRNNSERHLLCLSPINHRERPKYMKHFDVMTFLLANRPCLWL